MPEQPNDYRVAVFGASGVGKSSLVMRFVKGTFKEAYVPTIEDTFRQVRLTLLKLHSRIDVFSAYIRHAQRRAKLIPISDCSDKN